MSRSKSGPRFPAAAPKLTINFNSCIFLRILGNHMKSYLKNCHLITRHYGEILFSAEYNKVFARLDGYVIMPKERIKNLNEINFPKKNRVRYRK